MSLANIANVPHTDTELSIFSFANADSHLRIINAIRSKSGAMLLYSPVDPIPKADISTWGYMHQQMHNDMNSALGLAGNDLTDVDFSQPGQVAAWIELHFREHYAAENAAGA